MQALDYQHRVFACLCLPTVSHSRNDVLTADQVHGEDLFGVTSLPVLSLMRSKSGPSKAGKYNLRQ